MTSASAPLSVLLRALPEEARTGRLVGRAEVVDTGEVVTLRSIADLGALLERLAKGGQQ